MNYLDKTGLTRLWSKITTKLGQKQDTLVSGTNIKTINNQSLLGNGNINISGGGGGGASTDVQINGSSIVSNDVANIVTKGLYNASTNPLATMEDLDTKQDKLLESVWRFVIPGAVYEHAEGLVGNAIVNLYSDAASEYNVETLISNITSQETLYLNTIDYPLTKMVVGEVGDEVYIGAYNVDFSDGDYELGIERIDTSKPCFVVVLGQEPDAPSGHVLIIVSTEEIRQVPWAFVREKNIKYVSPVAITGNYEDLINKPSAIVVDTFDDLPNDVENYTSAYVKNASLYDITTLSSHNYDNTQMHDVSPYPEPDFSNFVHDVTGTFGLFYRDMIGKELVVSVTFVSDSGLLLVGGECLGGGYIYSQNQIDDAILHVPQGWSYLEENAGSTVSIDFNDIPLVPIYLMTMGTPSGNVYNADYVFCDGKKHWAGEYRFIDGEWKYQQTVITPFIDDSSSNVPTSRLVYKILVANSEAMTQIQETLQQLGG